MNTKLLMTATAVLTGVSGAIMLFLPDIVIRYTYFANAPQHSLFLQLMGSLYLAFTFLNWTARANLIGGIYSRPVALANFAHFFIGGLTLLKGMGSHPSLFLLISTLIYAVFATLFGIITFGHPLPEAK